jgi:hypothetical protein
MAEHAQAFQTFQQQKQADDQRKTGETAKADEERQKREAANVLEAIPALKDPVKGKAVWEAIVSGAQQHYGVRPRTRFTDAAWKTTWTS